MRKTHTKPAMVLLRNTVSASLPCLAIVEHQNTRIFAAIPCRFPTSEFRRHVSGRSGDPRCDQKSARDTTHPGVCALDTECTAKSGRRQPKPLHLEPGRRQGLCPTTSRRRGAQAVGARGLEPPTSRTRTVRANRTTLRPHSTVSEPPVWSNLDVSRSPAPSSNSGAP